MLKEQWYSLGIKEQLSNIHGEVVRMVRARNNYLSGKRAEELLDEENELKRWIDNEVDDRCFLRYWEQYTNAIS